MVDDDATHDTSAGHARYHSTHRERDHKHAEDHIAGHRGAVQRGALWSSTRYRRGVLPADSVANGRRDVVSRHYQRPDGRAVLPRTVFLAGPVAETDVKTARSAGPGAAGGGGTPMTAMVVADRACKDFGALKVLKGVTLTVEPGQVMCIVGPSGSGKSTFLRRINHLENISAGRLYVDGELVGYRESRGKLHELPARESAKQRRDVGMVFQHFNLFPHRTALSNSVDTPIHVKKVAKAAALQRGRDLLQRVGLSEKADAYPAQRAGGQRQRCGVALAVAMDPKLMLFDEPTSALDPELVGEVLNV